MTSPWGEGIPTGALLAIGVAAAAIVSTLQALDVASQRLSFATVEDLVEDEAHHALLLSALIEQRTRTTLVVRGFRILWQVVFSVSLTLALAGLGLPWWATGLLVLSFITFLHFVFISPLPSRWGAHKPERIALRGAPLTARLVNVTHVLDPLVRILCGKLPQATQTEAEARAAMVNDLYEMVDQVGETKGFEAEDGQMLRSVLDLGHTLVREVMVPRTEMVTARVSFSAHKALRLFIRSGFSRILVEDDDVDDIRGILYFKDAVQCLETCGADLDQNAEQMMHPVEFTVEMKPADDLLRLMQAEHLHMAIVIDEYGGVASLVTLEDLIEEVVGELTDEHDHVILEPEDLGDGLWRVPTRLPISELSEFLGTEFENEDVDPVGSLFAKAIGRVPLPDAIGTIGGMKLRVEEARGRRCQVGTILAERSEDDNEDSGTGSEG